MIFFFDIATLPITPWKNGAGATREIIAVPSTDAPFLWRASIATLQADGPFSPFPGVDRVITLLEGAGVQLLTDDGSVDHRLGTPLAPFAFAGEASVTSTLLGGDCHDFNVMTRRNRCRERPGSINLALFAYRRLTSMAKITFHGAADALVRVEMRRDIGAGIARLLNRGADLLARETQEMDRVGG